MCPLDASFTTRISFYNTTASGGKERCDYQTDRWFLKIKCALPQSCAGEGQVWRSLVTAFVKYSIKFWVPLVIFMSVSQFCGTVLRAVLYMAVPVITLAASYSTGSIDWWSLSIFVQPLRNLSHTPQQNGSKFCVIYLEYACQLWI